MSAKKSFLLNGGIYYCVTEERGWDIASSEECGAEIARLQGLIEELHNRGDRPCNCEICIAVESRRFSHKPGANV